MTKNANKTQPTGRDVADFIERLPANQQKDAQVLTDIMHEISGSLPVLWGSRIVGFGTYHYRSKSGREGDWMRIGFAPGSGKFSLYLTSDAADLTSKIEGLGKFKIGKGCVYINKLADVDAKKLKELVRVAYTNGNPYA